MSFFFHFLSPKISLGFKIGWDFVVATEQSEPHPSAWNTAGRVDPVFIFSICPKPRAQHLSYSSVPRGYLRPQTRRRGRERARAEERPKEDEKEKRKPNPSPPLLSLSSNPRSVPLGHQGHLLSLPTHLPAEFGPPPRGPLSSTLKTQFCLNVSNVRHVILGTKITQVKGTLECGLQGPLQPGSNLPLWLCPHPPAAPSLCFPARDVCSSYFLIPQGPTQRPPPP